MVRKSRAQRFSDVKDKVTEAKEAMETLRDELQSWLDNMPENLQDGQKAAELQETIDALDDVISNLEDAENADIEFPGAV